MDESLVTIATFSSMLEADTTRARLEERGIPAVVRPSVVSGDGMGKAALRVSERDAERALAELGWLEDAAGPDAPAVEDPAETLPAGPPDPPAVRCPVCGSEFVERRSSGPLGGLFRELLAQLLERPGRERYVCRVCGSRWREGEEAEIPKLG